MDAASFIDGVLVKRIKDTESTITYFKLLGDFYKCIVEVYA